MITVTLKDIWELINHFWKKSAVNVRDKRIANELIQTLNLIETQYLLEHRAHIPGFNYNLIAPIDDYLGKVSNESYSFNNRTLSEKFNDFTARLKQYRELTSRTMIHENGFFILPESKKKEIPDKREEELNTKARDSFRELKKLLAYLRKKEIME